MIWFIVRKEGGAYEQVSKKRVLGHLLRSDVAVVGVDVGGRQYMYDLVIKKFHPACSPFRESRRPVVYS